MGRPRIYFVVADGQGELFCDGDGKLRVRGATDSAGLARCRYEMPLYSHRNSGQKKIDDDFVDALRGLMSTFGVAAGTLTDDEQLQAATPEKYRRENLTNERGGFDSPEKEMAYFYQLAQAKQRVQSPQLTQFDEFGSIIGQDYIDEEVMEAVG